MKLRITNRMALSFFLLSANAGCAAFTGTGQPPTLDVDGDTLSEGERRQLDAWGKLTPGVTVEPAPDAFNAPPGPAAPSAPFPAPPVPMPLPAPPAPFPAAPGAPAAPILPPPPPAPFLS